MFNQVICLETTRSWWWRLSSWSGVWAGQGHAWRPHAVRSRRRGQGHGRKEARKVPEIKIEWEQYTLAGFDLIRQLYAWVTSLSRASQDPQEADSSTCDGFSTPTLPQNCRHGGGWQALTGGGKHISKWEVDLFVKSSIFSVTHHCRLCWR